MPEDLMGTILNESLEAAGENRSLPEYPEGSGGSWDENPERVGVTFNLSKQLAAEIERLRRDLRQGNRPSRSEVAEAALRIAVEDMRERGAQSELRQRLEGAGGDQAESAAAGTTRRSVDESGWIFETTYDGNGEVLDEDVIGSVAELPVMEEYVDGQGRLVSLSEDDLGNTFEQIMDDSFSTLATRLLRTRATPPGEGGGS